MQPNNGIELQPQQQRVAFKPAVSVQVHNKGYEALPEPDYKRKSSKQRHFGGLKFSLRGFAVVAAVVLITNISWFFWAKKKYGISAGYGTIQRGDCAVAKRINTWLHLWINAMSTLLLMGSNAFMQTFSGPTREEVDRAHGQHRWLHIGALSFRNMRGIAKRKVLVCLVLAMSSIPFHLLYNSLVFTSLSTNEYEWAVVTEDFLTGASWNLTASDSMVLADAASNDMYQNIQKSASSYERLDQASCITLYSKIILPTNRNVLLVTSEKNTNNSILMSGSISAGLGSDFDRSDFWICSKDDEGGDTLACNPNDLLSNPEAWKVHDHPIEYCLSERTGESCAVQFSYNIMVVVIIFNAIKLATMLFVLFRLDAEKILASPGDAMASFLIVEDRNTQGMCLANKREIDSFWGAKGFGRPYNKTPGRWGRAASKKRWSCFVFLLFVALATVLILLYWGLTVLKGKGLNISLPGLWKLGFGALNPNAFVLADDGGAAAGMALLANSPQVILALLYIVYKGLMTAMFNAKDWSNFGFGDQHLMVSTPAGKQRGTWVLGVPKYSGMALLVLQTLLHWLISESIFVVQVTVFGTDGQINASDHISNCGYSPIAIVFTVVAAVTMMLTAVVFGLCKSPEGGPPIVSTCSAAISAACHPGPTHEAMPYKEIRWGATGPVWNGSGHCSIVSQKTWAAGQAGKPMHGYLYAG